MRFCGIHLRAIFRIMPRISVLDMSLKITNLISLPHPPGASELCTASITKQNSSYYWMEQCNTCWWMNEAARQPEKVTLLLVQQTSRKVEIKPDYQLNCRLTHWGRNKMAAISQTTFSNAFSWMKMYECWLRFQWSLFLKVQLTIFQH